MYKAIHRGYKPLPFITGDGAQLVLPSNFFNKTKNFHLDMHQHFAPANLQTFWDDSQPNQQVTPHFY